MIIGLAFIASAIGLFFLVYGTRNLSGANDWAKLLQALFTLTAFGLAGYWYFVERKGMPHADVSQELFINRLGSSRTNGGLVSVEAHVRIKNLGERLLRIDRIDSALQDLESASYAYDTLARQAQGRPYWNAARPKGRDPQFHVAELRWPIVRQFSDTVEHFIEPGETDLFVITFLVRCSEVHEVRVATNVYRPGGDPDDPLAWKARSFGNIRSICEPNERRGTNDSAN